MNGLQAFNRYTNLLKWPNTLPNEFYIFTDNTYTLPRRKRRSRRLVQHKGKRKRTEELAWTKVRDKYWNNKAKFEVEQYRNDLRQQYGFLADPSKMLWENIEKCYGNIDPCTSLIGRPMTIACHNICANNKASERLEHLLGLVAKYCV